MTKLGELDTPVMLAVEAGYHPQTGAPVLICTATRKVDAELVSRWLLSLN